MSARSGVAVSLILTPPMSCNAGKTGFMKPSTCMKKFSHKASLEPSGLSNADVAGTARRPGEDAPCSSHRSRSLFFKDSHLVVHPGSQATDRQETSRTGIDLPAQRDSAQDVCVDPTVHEHAPPASWSGI